MTTSILFVRAIIASVVATLTIWRLAALGVVLTNVSHIDAFMAPPLEHLRNNSPLPHWERRRTMSTSLLFLKRTSSSSSTTTTTIEKQQQNNITDSHCLLEWQVYVDQSAASLDKGGSATLDAFLGLAPAVTVQVKPALLPMGSYYAASPNYASSSGISSSSGSSGINNPNSNNYVGPFVRCIPLRRDKKGNNMEEADGADATSDDDNNSTDARRAFDVCNVDSVDKVYRILTKHMRVQGVTTAACDCLKWKYKANAFLEAGQISLAIEAYDKALEIVSAAAASSKTQQQIDNGNEDDSTATTPSSSSSSSSLHHQEGALYLMRATAYLQRARRLRKELKATMLKFSNLVSSSTSTSSLSQSHQPVTTALLKTVAQLAATNPDPSKVQNGQGNTVREEGKEQPSLLSAFWGGSKSSSSSSSSSTTSTANNAAATVTALQQAILRRILRDASAQEFQFRRTLYMHSLYQHALLQAAQDALYSTELLPDYPTAWQQAGDVFSDLWKLPESTMFYQRAIQLDNDDEIDDNEEDRDSPSWENSSSPSTPRLQQQQQRRRLETTLKPVIERLKRRQQLLDQARSYYGWSEDTLRLALDVAATSMKGDLQRP